MRRVSPLQEGLVVLLTSAGIVTGLLSGLDTRLALRAFRDGMGHANERMLVTEFSTLDTRDGCDGLVEPSGTLAALYATELTRSANASELREETVAEVFRRAGVRDRQPFVIGADGSYDMELNRFFRELNIWGVRAENSIAAYTRDVMLFCRFLHASRGGKSIWECDGEDLRTYKSVRLHMSGDQQVSVGTWRRSIAALDKWAAWAMHEKLIETAPFRYRDKTVLTPQGMRRVRVNVLQEPAGHDEPIRFLAFEDYLLWRDVGLRGELPDGGADPAWRGRHGERNAIFADLLIYSGMRLGEGASLLVPEIPSNPAFAGGRAPRGVSLSAAVTKRNKARTVFVNRRTLTKLYRYLDVERDEVVTRCVASGTYRTGESTLWVKRAGSTGVTLAGGRGLWSYSKIDMRARRELMAVNDDGEPAGPLWLWLGGDGLPLACSTWQSAFHRANERCASFDLDLTVTPHTLRHSFAVHMLGLLLRQTVRALGMQADRRFTHAEVKRLLIGNPMRKLQLLLGHAHEATVYTYLDVLDEAQEIVASALDEWDAQAAALDITVAAAGEADDADGAQG
jgi:site-specific recombinase XerD